MAIPDQLIDQIQEKTDIVEVISRYVPLKKLGRNYKAPCPFHNEKTPSFIVSPDKQIYHCFGCGAGGDVFTFVMMIDSLSWPESIRKLASRCGVVIEETTAEVVKRSEKQKLYDLLEQAARYYHRMFKESPAGKTGREYLKKRGVNGESIEKFVLGFAPKGSLIEQAKKKGYTVEDLAAAGIVTRTERGNYFEYMSDRLVFPILDTQGRVVAFGGRTLKDDQPKYLNTPETAVYSKSSQLYGLFQALPTVRSRRELMVLEGYMDVVVTHQFGVSYTVATLGTSLTAQHAQSLSRYADNITLLFDSDEAGFAAAKRATDILFEKDFALKISSLPPGVDPDEYLVAHGAEPFNELIERNRQSAIEFLTAMALRKFGTDSPEAKARAVQELVPVVARAHNAVLAGEWIKYIAGETGTAETAIVSEVKRASRTTVRSAPQEPAPAKRVAGIRSAEEELIQLIAAFPQFSEKVDERIFSDDRCIAVFQLLVRHSTVAEIAVVIPETIRQWFTELALEEKTYPAPEEILRTLVFDLEQRRRELRRMFLKVPPHRLPTPRLINWSLVS